MKCKYASFDIHKLDLKSTQRVPQNGIYRNFLVDVNIFTIHWHSFLVCMKGAWFTNKNISITIIPNRNSCTSLNTKMGDHFRKHAIQTCNSSQSKVQKNEEKVDNLKSRFQLFTSLEKITFCIEIPILPFGVIYSTQS